MTTPKILDKKYDDGLINLLCYFLEDSNISLDERNIRHTIQRYVITFDEFTIEKTILHCLEILAQDDFPYFWLESIVGSKLNSAAEWKSWLSLTLRILHEEAYR